jgi:tetratricopeptide (TPR) repeat protein
MSGPAAGAAQSKRSIARARWAVAIALTVAALAVAGWQARKQVIIGRAARATRRAVAEGRYAEAEGHLARWLRARPGSDEAHELKARVALAADRLPEAAAEWQRARELGRPLEALDPVRAMLLARQGGHEAEAEPILLTARSNAQETDPQVEEALARIYLATYRFGFALDAIDRWRRAAPGDPKPYLWKVEVDDRTDAGPAALIADYREALRRNPDLDRARLGLADALRRANQHREAAAEYTAYLDRKPDDPAGLVGAGEAALALGGDAEAIRRFDRALAIDPEHVPALLARAGVAMRRGEAAAALGLLDRALRREPDDPEIRHRRSMALARLGRADEARAEREAAARVRRDAARLAELRDRLVRTPGDLGLQAEAARWLIEHGHDAEGLAWARKVLATRPDHPETCRLLADYYERRGDHGLARGYRVQAASPGRDPARRD